MKTDVRGHLFALENESIHVLREVGAQFERPVLLFSGGLQALQTLVIIVAGPFMLVICAMCVSLMKSLRAEPFESTLPPRVRRAVQHAQQYDSMEHHTVALAAYGAEPEEVAESGDNPSKD